MTLYRYALTATVLAACQMAAAQAQPAAPVTPIVPGSSLSTESAGSVVSASEVPTSTADDATGKAQPPGGTPGNTEPRIIRGNDRVIAPAKAVPRIEGGPASFNFEEAPVAEVVRTILGDIIKAD